MAFASLAADVVALLERLGIEAATTGSRAAALKALLAHPLVPNAEVADEVLQALTARGLVQPLQEAG